MGGDNVGWGAHGRLEIIATAQRWGNILIFNIDTAGPEHTTDPIFQQHRKALGYSACTLGEKTGLRPSRSF